VRGRVARKRLRAASAVAFVSAVVAATAAGCGSTDGVVGDTCANGYTQCGPFCIWLDTDDQNCGKCGHVCPTGIACERGVCGGLEPDGAPFPDASEDSSVDATLNDGESSDGTVGDGQGEDAPLPEGGPRRLPDGNIELPDGEVERPDGEIVPPPEDAAPEDAFSPLPDGETLLPDGAIELPDGGILPPDASLPDGETREPDGAIELEDGAILTEDACAPPYDTPSNCGTCGHVCTNPNGLCELVDGSYACSPTCSPPLTDCAGSCVNLLRDPNNCGTCGNRCASELCFLATCQGSASGNAFIIGHDFQGATGGDAQTILLRNAVFYNRPTSALRLLSFEQYANAAAVANGKSLLAGDTTYTATITVSVQGTATDIATTGLKNEDAVIIWDQPNAPSGTLGTLGTKWAANLAVFQQQGGIVIVLDADQGVGQMGQFLTNAGILAVTGQGQYPAGSAADDTQSSIAEGMPVNEYAVQTNTGWFTTSETASATTIFVANVHGTATELLAVQKITN
jgi:hypothetical protein